MYDNNNQLHNNSLEDHELHIDIAIHSLSFQDILLLNMVEYLQRILLSKYSFFGQESDTIRIAISFDQYQEAVLRGLLLNLGLLVELDLKI